MSVETNITLFSHPVLAVKTLGQVILEKLGDLLSFSKKHWKIIMAISIIAASTFIFERLHFMREFGYFCLYWIILGVASSIGLGTGLHTFVLYLGPHIAKVAMTATQCGYVPKMIPSRWNFDHFEHCPEPKTTEISFLTILFAVQIQAFLWGLGTALGQLPPYYMAKHAAEANDKKKEIQQHHEENMKLNKRMSQQELQEEEMETLKLQLQVSEVQEQLEGLKEVEKLQKVQSTEGLPLIQRAKLLIFHMLQKHGFITVLLCASIPNPLFDLAGITCGHFKIPFTTFFTATFIGKAIIKVHIQMLFIITLFRKTFIENLLKSVQSFFPSLENRLIETLNSQKKLLFSPKDFQENKPLVGKLWDIFLMCMILYFLISIINSSIQHKLIERKLEIELARRSNVATRGSISEKEN